MLLERLDRKPRRQFLGYRIAAACLIISLIPVARLFREIPVRGKQRPAIAQPITPLASRGTTNPEPAAVPEPMQRQGSRTPLTTPPPARTANPRLLSGSLATLNRSPVKTPAAAIGITSRPLATAIELTSHQVATATVAALPPASVTGPIQQRKPAKKEWKVVDLNDLDPGRQRPHEMATNRKPAFIRFGAGGRDTPGPDNSAPARNEDDRRKINLSTDNR
jgi:hypothetical protein